MSKTRLIAGFFRYHREKLNYSLTGLINDKSIVGESSLCDFENGKRELSESQLKYLFTLIGHDYENVINSYSFENEYSLIIDNLYNGNGYAAKEHYNQCVSNGVYNSVACLNFVLLEFVMSVLCKEYHDITSNLVFKCKHLLDESQILLFEFCIGINFRNSGQFDKSICVLETLIDKTYDYKLRALIAYHLGSVFDQIGDYDNARAYIKIAQEIYSNKLNFKKMIQVNLSLGTISLHCNSFKNAEIAYIKAYYAALELKDYIKVTTKCFNSLCWLYFQINDYDRLNEFLQNKPENLFINENSLFVLAWSCYKTNRVDECVQYCREARNKYKDREYPQVVFQYIEDAVLNKKSNQERLLKKAIKLTDYEHNKETEELFTYELIDFYKRKGDFENACKYYDKLRKKA